MASSEYLLSHQELVKAVIIHQNIHEGFWRLNINFNVAATHGKEVPDPCLAVTIHGIGIMQAEPNDEMAVDAALTNPEKIEPAPDANRDAPVGMQFCRDVYRNIAVHLDDAARPVSAAHAVDLRAQLPQQHK
ncbi:hypothetical protein [Paraburkholderia phenazinium]|jgi:hypothetical protein|uniref:Uncharacterized protein n=1 Tax=Paraburkholderia phenazinium TaxID=60549 RepID=A0A1G8P604_9BURK|nr:hypothetical protein [Paraburkholderia phenazinium]SDI87929.1 hypothetical protein SAMN05216466_14110 [Paraburkholderia phenazinium]